MKLRSETMTRLTAQRARRFVAAPAVALTLAVGSLSPATVVIGGGAVMLTPTPAAAIPVYDAANHVQNLLVAARALEQINKQIQQIENQYTQISNQAKMLENFGTDYFSGLQGLRDQTEELLDLSNSIANGIAQVEASYEDLYPEEFDASSIEFATIRDRLEQQRDANRAAALEALKIGAQISRNNAQRGDRAADIIAASESAPGAKAVNQATNQLLGVLIEQVSDLTDLVNQTSKVQQMLAAEKANQEEMRLADEEAFWAARKRVTSADIGDMTPNVQLTPRS